MTHKALQIGINYIGTSNELHGCVNDIMNMNKFLLKEGYMQENIKIMTETNPNPLLRPTGQNILRELKWLAEGATSQSRLFFNYSGHGGSIQDLQSDESDHKDETLCPVDYARNGQITDDMIRMYLIDSLPSGCQLTCLMDCCHSGTILDLKYNWVGSTRKAGTYTLTINRSKNTAARVISFSGCMDQQYSADAWEEGIAQGAMTYSFLKTMKKYNNKRPSFMKIIEEMDRLLREKGYDQVPQLSSGRKVDLDDEFSTIKPTLREIRALKKSKKESGRKRKRD